jgi:hypothetical protein
MYYPFVEKIVVCFPNAALLYHVNNGSNTYKIYDNIHIVGALRLILVSILVYLVAKGIHWHLLQGDPIWSGGQTLKPHLVRCVHEKCQIPYPFHSWILLSKELGLWYILSDLWLKSLINCHYQIRSFQILHVAWQALYITTLQGNASFNAHLPYKLDDGSGGTSDLVPGKTFRHLVFQVMYSTCNT